jgi:Glycosyltransferase
VINMDGIEWKRQKWSAIGKAWFWLNERFGCWFGSHLVADHPRIKDHLATRVSAKKITMIPYGGVFVGNADESLLESYAVAKNNYSIVIARPEPENSILEVVQAFSAKSRGDKLLVLGEFMPDVNAYHRKVIDAASEDVIFPGAIYEADVIGALRYHARFYIHGHQVGGTNPSLVEALGAGCAIIAHDNQFNRWVSDKAAFYFNGVDHLTDFFDGPYYDDNFVSEKKKEANLQFEGRFKWNDILCEYELLLNRFS